MAFVYIAYFCSAFLTVRAKYSCEFPNRPVAPIIVAERYLDLCYKRISQSTVINQCWDIQNIILLINESTTQHALLLMP